MEEPKLSTGDHSHTAQTQDSEKEIEEQTVEEWDREEAEKGSPQPGKDLIHHFSYIWKNMT